MKFYDKAGNEYSTLKEYRVGSLKTNLKLTLGKVKAQVPKLPRKENNAAEEPPYVEHVEPLLPEEMENRNDDEEPTEEEKESHTPITATVPADTAPSSSDGTYTKIEIDYAHECVNLFNAEGKVIASTPIDPNLVRNTIDADLADALFGNTPVPEEIRTNIESIPTTEDALMNEVQGQIDDIHSGPVG